MFFPSMPLIFHAVGEYAPCGVFDDVIPLLDVAGYAVTEVNFLRSPEILRERVRLPHILPNVFCPYLLAVFLEVISDRLCERLERPLAPRPDECLRLPRSHAEL